MPPKFVQKTLTINVFGGIYHLICQQRPSVSEEFEYDANSLLVLFPLHTQIELPYSRIGKVFALAVAIKSKILDLSDL